MEREVSWGSFVEKTSQGTSRHRAVLREFDLRNEWEDARARKPLASAYS